MKEKNKIKLKEDDVYHFQWSSEEYEKEGYGGALRHCFEGLLVVRKVRDELKLVDTYWGLKGDGKDFTLQESTKRGTLEWYCNLNDVKSIGENQRVYYSDDDIIFLHEQHACDTSCKFYYIKKGAKRSQAKMLSVVQREIDERKDTIRYATDDLEMSSKKYNEIKNGNLEVLI